MSAADPDVTVLVTASPIPSHPSTVVLDACLTSVRERLPDAQVYVLCDGIRDDLAHRRDAYDQFLRNVKTDIADGRWGNAQVVEWGEHQHQARMVRHALANLVDTPFVLLMEHDVTLQDDIPFDSLVNLMHSGEAKCVRFHHESRVLPSHEWLNVDGGHRVIHSGVPLIATAQFSARPHLADADWYRWLLDGSHFHPDARCFIEDQAHGVVLEDWRNDGVAGWAKHRLWIYAERNDDGSIQRSNTCDGRGDDPKAPNRPLPLEGIT